MIVKLPSSKVRWADDFSKEISLFPEEAQEALVRLIDKYQNGERLSPKQFKTFWIDGQTKILEFKVKDHAGNWRAIAVRDTGWLTLIHAFHMKAQELSEKVKRTIRARVRRIS